MAIQHKDIADEERHEPKGASDAGLGSVYISDGQGSGIWKKMDVSSLSGLFGDGNSANRKVLTDGAGSFRLASDAVYVEMGITSNAVPFAIGVATNPSLDVTGEYVQLAGVGAPWGGGLGSEAGYLTNKVNVGVNGIYRVSLLATVVGFPSASARVGFKIRTTNGVTPFIRSKAVLQATATNSVEQSALDELVNLVAGDELTVWVASTVTGNITVQEMSLIAQLIKAT